MQSILILNSGSSSIKFAVFTADGNGYKTSKKYSGLIDHIITKPLLRIKDSDNKVICDKELNTNNNHNYHDNYEYAIHEILEQLKNYGVEIIAAGHRVVHGAMRYRTATLITPEIFAFLETLNLLAPLHQPYNLKGIKILGTYFNDLPQVACFDTAFHTTCNDLTQLFAIPQSLTDEGVRRYGFHGLSYEYVASCLDSYLPPEKAAGKIIVAHLGQGASMCALKNRKSVATTLSFSALDGLPMGTRCGNIDPGVLLYLMEQHKMDHKQLEKFLFKECGLLGVSGVSSDMRALLQSDNPKAKLAIDLFVYRIGAWIGMLAAELQGLDGLIFTAGIGEHSPYIREKICEKAAWLGAKIDQQKNANNEADIAHKESKLSLNVIPTDEELMIAQHTLKAIQPSQTGFNG